MPEPEPEMPAVFVGEAWLLDHAHRALPGDPDVRDYGALAAAEARHRHTVMGRLVYAGPRHRAAALLHSLARVPALEHSNELFAATVAAAYLHASGLPPVTVSTEAAVDLVEATVGGRLDVRQVAAKLKTWTSPPP